MIASAECVGRFLFQDHDFLRRWEGKFDNTESCNVDDLTSQHYRYLARLMPLIHEESTIVSRPDLFSQFDYYLENKAVNQDNMLHQRVDTSVERQTATGGSDTVINLWHDSTDADKAKAVEIEEEESVQKSFVFSTQNNTMKGVRELLKEAIITLIEPKSLKVENGGLVDKSEERTKWEEETKELSSAKEVEENENVACFFCCDSGSDGSGFAR
ncbi:hypothetical protein Tco_0667742 [Tanacetum coccineum]